MEITKDDYFDVKYNEKRNVLEVKNHKSKSSEKKRKFIICTLSVMLTLATINIVLIYKFFDVLLTL